MLFDGHSAAVTEQPLMAKVGERVRLYFHMGPNDQASTHVIGAIFDRVWYEGNPKNEMAGCSGARRLEQWGRSWNSSCRSKGAAS